MILLTKVRVPTHWYTKTNHWNKVLYYKKHQIKSVETIDLSGVKYNNVGHQKYKIQGNKTSPKEHNNSLATDSEVTQIGEKQEKKSSK
jgi:hypothetical protein